MNKFIEHFFDHTKDKFNMQDTEIIFDFFEVRMPFLSFKPYNELLKIVGDSLQFFLIVQNVS